MNTAERNRLWQSVTRRELPDHFRSAANFVELMDVVAAATKYVNAVWAVASRRPLPPEEVAVPAPLVADSEEEMKVPSAPQEPAGVLPASAPSQYLC